MVVLTRIELYYMKYMIYDKLILYTFAYARKLTI